ncbi:MAG: ABC transporter substrate-binding protein [Chloroflexi bacterium]|nr:ABC transporter substrate-binding protein [Chloroflexota bacterium]
MFRISRSPFALALTAFALLAACGPSAAPAAQPAAQSQPPPQSKPAAETKPAAPAESKPTAPAESKPATASSPAAAAKPGDAPAAKPSGPKEKLKLADYSGTAVDLPTNTAIELGLFEKHGVDLEVIHFGGGGEVGAAILSGAADMGGQSPEQAALMHKQGLDAKLIVGVMRHSLLTLVVRNEVPLPNLAAGWPKVMEDLKGKKIAVTQRGTSSDYVVQLSFEQAGLNPQQNVTTIPAGSLVNMLAALQAGQVDGANMFEPATTQAVHQLKIAQIAIDYRKGQGPPLFKDYMQTGLLVKADTIKNRPEAMKRVVAAMVEAQQFIQDPKNFDRMLQIGAKHMKGVEPALLPQMMKDNNVIYDHRIPEKAVQNVQEIQAKFGQIDKPYPYAQLVATELAPK